MTYMAAAAVDKALDSQLYQLKQLRTSVLAVNERDPRVRSLDSIVDVLINEAAVVRELGAELEEE